MMRANPTPMGRHQVDIAVLLANLSLEGARMTDWMAMLKEQRTLGDQLANEIPRTLTAPGLTLDQATKLYQALEKQAAFMERFVRKLEENSFDPDVIQAAERLEDLFAELAESAAVRTKELRDLGT